MKIDFFFAWFDFWIGWFYDQNKRILYVCPLPCCLFKFERNSTKHATECFYCGENKPLASVVVCKDCVDELTHIG